MDIDIKALARRAVYILQEEVQITNSTLKDKGMKRFAPTFVAGGAFILAAYIMIYLPANAKLAAIGQKIALAKAESEAASSYKSLSDNLSQVYSQLPSGRQPGDWLNISVLNCLKQENVTADSIDPKEEPRADEFLLDESVSVTADMTYAELLAVLNRLEHLRPRVQISSLHLEKNPVPLGTNKVIFDVETLVPSQRFTP